MLTEHLQKLKMAGALGALNDLKSITNPEDFASGLLNAEWLYRQDRSRLRKLSQAKFPLRKEWSQWDQKLNPRIPIKKIESVATKSLIDQKRNLCFIGGQGTGKTHCLIAFGTEICRQGYSVRFFTACKLVNALEEARSQNQLSRFMQNIQKVQLLIIDELGYIPFSQSGSRLLFDVFSSRYEQGSIAISSNLSFEKWTEVFGAVELTAALVDRFTHLCEIFTFEGESVRLRSAREHIQQRRAKK